MMHRTTAEQRADQRAGEGCAEPTRPAWEFRRIALVGNPNVGKSVIFGALTADRRLTLRAAGLQ